MNYSFKNFDGNVMARTQGLGLPISRKQSIVICDFIRNKEVKDVKDILQEVIEKKRVIPFKRFNRNMGHKKKIGPGRYPMKSCREILKLIENVEANAQFKGLNTSRLYIKHICANQGSKAMHYGRKSRRKMKRTNIEIIVEEKKAEQKSDKKKAGVHKHMLGQSPAPKRGVSTPKKSEKPERIHKSGSKPKKSEVKND